MLVRAYEPDQLRAAHRRVYAPPKVDILDSNKGPRAAILDHCQLPHIGLSYGSYTAGVRLQFPETDFASQLFSLAGNSEALINGTPISIHRDRSVVISPRETLNVINNAGYRQLVASPAGERIFRGKLGASDCRRGSRGSYGSERAQPEPFLQSRSRMFADRICLPLATGSRSNAIAATEREHDRRKRRLILRLWRSSAVHAYRGIRRASVADPVTRTTYSSLWRWSVVSRSIHCPLLLFGPLRLVASRQDNRHVSNSQVIWSNCRVATGRRKSNQRIFQ